MSLFSGYKFCFNSEEEPILTIGENGEETTETPTEIEAKKTKLKAILQTVEDRLISNEAARCLTVSEQLIKHILQESGGEIRPNLRGGFFHYSGEYEGIIFDGNMAQFFEFPESKTRDKAFLFVGTEEELRAFVTEKLKTLRFKRTHPGVDSSVQSAEDFVRHYYNEKIVTPGNLWYEKDGRWWLPPSSPQE